MTGKPKCVVGGVVRSGKRCANVIGGRWCGRPGRCRHQRDRCEACSGERGGVPGNENIVDGKVLCDYCHADA